MRTISVRRFVLIPVIALVSAFGSVSASQVARAASTSATSSMRAETLLRSARESLSHDFQGEGPGDSPSTGVPNARCCSAMDYDPEFVPPQSGTGAVLLYGGDDGTTVYQDTWAWDGSTWAPVTTATSPGQLRSVRMTWDAAQHELVMFGGSNALIDSPSTANRKTWLFKKVGSTFDWVWCNCDSSILGLISPGLAYDNYVPPSGPSNDATAQQVIEFSGDKGGVKSSNTYAFNGTTWSLLSPMNHPIALASPGMAFHTQRNQVILFGGICDSGTGCSAQGFYGLTWGWNGSSWTQLAVTNPPARTGHRMAYDPNLGGISGLYLFGGQNETGLLQDTWYLPPIGNWTQCASGLCVKNPTQRCCTGMAFDGRNGLLTLFGGGNCAAGDAACNTYFNDTWTFDAVNGWLCKAGTCSPP